MDTPKSFFPDNNAPVMRGTKIRMAYCLNDEQPVLCTLLSDQPYFYIDEEIGYDESGLDDLHDDLLAEFDPAEAARLEKELLRLHREERSWQESESASRPTQNDLYAAFDAQDFYKSDAGQDADLDEIINDVVEGSRSGAAMIAWAWSQGIIIGQACLDTSYLVIDDKILINRAETKTRQVAFLIEGLAKIWQAGHGADLSSLAFHPDFAVLVERAREAGAEALCARIAWEMKLAGKEAPWMFMIENGKGDLLKSFAGEAMQDFRSLNSGRAAAAVFESWFLSDRTLKSDRHLINNMLTGYSLLGDKGGQETYVSARSFLQALGHQPIGKNFLSPYCDMILNDDLFTNVRDRANANFLWFVKFERNFATVERLLQRESGGPQGTDAPDFSAADDQKESRDAYDNILSFPSRSDRQKRPLSDPGYKTFSRRNNIVRPGFGRCESET